MIRWQQNRCAEDRKWQHSEDWHSRQTPHQRSPPNCRTADHQESGRTLLFRRSRLSLFRLPCVGHATPDESVPRSVSSLRGPQVHLVHGSGRVAQLLFIGEHSAAGNVRTPSTRRGTEPPNPCDTRHSHYLRIGPAQCLWGNLLYHIIAFPSSHSSAAKP